MMLARDIPKPETFGVPVVYAAGDVNRDGVCDGFDPQDWDDYNDYGVGALAVDLDVNRDGVVDSADRALVQGHADWALWTSHGRGSASRLHNRRCYAGYEYDPATAQWHVRHRVLVSEMGRWNRRDPLGYVDGMSVYEYVRSMPVVATDPSGLVYDQCPSGECGVNHRLPIGNGSFYPDPTRWPIGPHRDLACDRWAKNACDRPGLRAYPSCYDRCVSAASSCCSGGGSEASCTQRGLVRGTSCVDKILSPILACTEACLNATWAAICEPACGPYVIGGVVTTCAFTCQKVLPCLSKCLAGLAAFCTTCAIGILLECYEGCGGEYKVIVL